MKAFLTALSWLMLLLGIFSLSVPVTLLSSVFSGEWSAFTLAAIVPTLVLAISMGWFSASFLKRKGMRAANRMAYVAGFFVWISTKSLAYDYSADAQEHFGKWALLAVVLLPVLLGIFTTKTIKLIIRKAYEADSADYR